VSDLESLSRIRELLIEHGISFSGGLSFGFVISPPLFQIGVNVALVGQIKRNRSIDLFERQDGKCLSDTLSRLTVQKSVYDGVQRDTAASDPISTVSVFDILPVHVNLASHPKLKASLPTAFGKM
jgi:hypothetical protein